MNANIFLAVLISLLIGAGGGYLIASNTSGTVSMPGDDTANQSEIHEAMDSMTAGLTGKTGDDFDKAFLSEMITHHEGAVVMAEAALINANHAEIKQMANAIISAQTTEIQQMKGWLSSWFGQE